MTLRSLANRYTSGINPNRRGWLFENVGYSVATDGSQVAAYSHPHRILAQVQPIADKELRQVENSNLGGLMRGIYLDGNWQSVLRREGRGGDYITFEAYAPEDGATEGIPTSLHVAMIPKPAWLVVQVLESWPGWTKVAVCQQL